MQLRDWLRQEGMTQDEFAAMVGRRRETVTRWIAFQKGRAIGIRPDFGSMTDIRHLTGGAVDYADWDRSEAPPSDPQLEAVGADTS